MAFKELKQEWDDFLAARAHVSNDAAGDQAARDAREYMQLRLLFDIASSLDSLAFSYRAMFELQKEREKRNGQASPRPRS